MDAGGSALAVCFACPLLPSAFLVCFACLPGCSAGAPTASRKIPQTEAPNRAPLRPVSSSSAAQTSLALPTKLGAAASGDAKRGNNKLHAKIGVKSGGPLCVQPICCKQQQLVAPLPLGWPLLLSCRLLCLWPESTTTTMTRAPAPQWTVFELPLARVCVSGWSTQCSSQTQADAKRPPSGAAFPPGASLAPVYFVSLAEGATHFDRRPLLQEKVNRLLRWTSSGKASDGLALASRPVSRELESGVQQSANWAPRPPPDERPAINLGGSAEGQSGN